MAIKCIALVVRKFLGQIFVGYRSHRHEDEWFVNLF
jgi:hypothetical protein